MIFASVCLYLIGGLIWGFGYLLIEVVTPNSFSNMNSNILATSQSFRALIDLIYFSFVTLSTLGYGDIAPLTRVCPIMGHH